MITAPGLPSVEVSNRTADTARERLRAYLTKSGQWSVEKNIDELFDLAGGFVGRFDFFLPHLPEQAFDRILISGCAIGSEHIVAQRVGFKEAFGTEVSQELVDIAKLRLEGHSNCRVDYYNGLRLPYPAEHFTTVYSGHVIEHTSSPFEYFAEHMRVLKPGGFFFLEFPNRYHWTELHTGTFSFEWLPLALRSLALKAAASSFSPASAKNREFYDLVRRTLQPVSNWQLRQFMRKLGLKSSKIVATQVPAAGFMRALIRKGS